MFLGIIIFLCATLLFYSKSVEFFSAEEQLSVVESFDILSVAYFLLPFLIIYISFKKFLKEENPNEVYEYYKEYEQYKKSQRNENIQKIIDMIKKESSLSSVGESKLDSILEETESLYLSNLDKIKKFEKALNLGLSSSKKEIKKLEDMNSSLESSMKEILEKIIKIDDSSKESLDELNLVLSEFKSLLSKIELSRKGE